MTKPPPIPVHPGPDFHGNTPATRPEIEEVLFSALPSHTAARLKSRVFYVTEHGVYEQGTKDGPRPRRTNKGDTRQRGR
ncbi:MAG: hypothetical protein AAB532_04275 [Patescibacteria group bacterium]